MCRMVFDLLVAVCRMVFDLLVAMCRMVFAMDGVYFHTLLGRWSSFTQVRSDFLKRRHVFSCLPSLLSVTDGAILPLSPPWAVA